MLTFCRHLAISWRGMFGIQGTIIRAVDRAIATLASADLQEIDANGLILLPGVIDPQVHFRELGLKYKEDLSTASHACATRGGASFIEMPNTRPLTNTQTGLEFDGLTGDSLSGRTGGLTPVNSIQRCEAVPQCLGKLKDRIC